jgi:hypothetical protein
MFNSSLNAQTCFPRKIKVGRICVEPGSGRLDLKIFCVMAENGMLLTKVHNGSHFGRRYSGRKIAQLEKRFFTLRE